MDTLFIPNENDFRRWIREALRECLENMPVKEGASADPQQEPLLTRKEIAGIFRVSLVTLHEWMKQGLPFHKQGGRVYFLRSEVLEYLKQKRKPQAKLPGHE
ncbi:DNA binding domain-containing protein, excisionase family [Chitinophaga eiseniae]|uniref:DNA binding domain-containing protein, excisionase family n=1 Tax=Chitinophaga eiseniae TaxID=634771 RepID=A0A1T4RBU7_9BACT|nr:helix-turn-helix domain-containing protein [Chitinophaga eiseniae]SKA13532.1 DNA binding domain-containing protein, excisionase family [Chitinophaga eiseniae]